MPALRRSFSLLFVLALSACVSFVAPYDPAFDQSLNKLSEETAKFVAAASAGGPEASASSKEATAFYAGAYNTLDRLSQRAGLARGNRACPGNEALMAFSERPSSVSALPEDYASFDCLEASLYYVRFYLDQLQYDHRSGGRLTPGEARASGGILQVSIAGAIQTFLAAKS